MNQTIQSVNKLLDQYVFAMAATVIDKLEKPEQDNLIEFLINLDAAPDPVSQSTTVENLPSELNIQASSVVEMPFYENGRLVEEQSSLTFPTAERSHDPGDYAAQMYRLIAIQQAQIDSTILHMARLRKLIERANKMQTNIQQKKTLLTQYQYQTDGNHAFLIRVQTLQQKAIHCLQRYQRQLA